MAVWYDVNRQSDADGAAIATLTDYSGNAKDATQSTAGDRPAMTYNAQYGKRAAFFSGGYASGDYMQAGDNLDLGTHGYVIYVSVKPQMSQTDSKLAFFISKGNNGVVASYLGAYGITYVWPGGLGSPESGCEVSAFLQLDVTFPYTGNIASTYVGGTSINNTWHVLGVTTLLGATQKIYKNGTQVASSASITPASVSGLDNSFVFNVGRGEQPATDYRGNGYIGEILIYHIDSLSNDNRMKLDGYFCHKWGLSASMDPAHPYYHYPP